MADKIASFVSISNWPMLESPIGEMRIGPWKRRGDAWVAQVEQDIHSDVIERWARDGLERGRIQVFEVGERTVGDT